MGIFTKVNCAACNEETGLNRQKIADKQIICIKCFKKTGLTLKDFINKPLKSWSIEDIKAAINKGEANFGELKSFNSTKKIGTYMEFDDVQEKWLVLSTSFGNRNKSTVYNYNDIVDFELLEDGESIAQGGLGRALVGGAIFGGTGAIVGGVTGKRKSKNVCNSLKIKITINDFNTPTVYVTFVSSATKRSGFMFKSIYNHAQECLSTLQLICDRQKNTSNNNVPTNSSADEILKFKELLDAGAITQDEYDTKKKELLGF